MKTKLMLPNTTALAVALALVQGASVAWADDAALKERTFSGTIAAVDAQGKSVKVHGWLGALTGRTFHLADDASILVSGSKPAMLADLKRGMEVKVSYKKADGIRVADRIQQRVHEHTSFVKSVSPQTRELLVHEDRLEQEYWLPEDCPILVHSRKADIADLKPGQRVRVEYVWNGPTRVATSVKDPSETLTGTVQAIDLTTGTIKVRHLFTEERFVLAPDCRVVAGDSLDGRLRDLQMGQKVTVDYRDIDGVLVAGRIAFMPGPTESEPGVAATTK